MMKKQKINFGNIFFTIFLLFCLFIQLPQVVYAGTLTTLKDRLNRQKENLTTGIIHTVVFTTQNAVSGGAGNNKVILVFPDADDGKWCRTAGNDVTYTACTEDGSNQLPGLPTARCTQGGVGTYDKIYVESVDNLLALTKYCLQVSDGTNAKLGTPANTTTGVITVKTNNGGGEPAGDVDSAKLTVDIVANEQVVVTATVPGAPPVPPGGGGGGGEIPKQTQVIFIGKAYPRQTVTLLKDAQVAAATLAGSEANFQINLSGLSAGNYIFSVYSEDREGRRSALLSFPVSVTEGVTTTVSGIFIAPTIDVDKSEVKRGDNISIFGQSVPSGEITIVISSDEEFFGKTKSDKDGIYLYNFDTTPLDWGQHFTKSKAALTNSISSFGKAVTFLVGTKNVFTKPPAKCRKADLNCDGRVNLVDFSIAAYWYKRTLSADFRTLELERLSGDGKVDLIDFSIMAYYWIG